ncbi:phosphotransacetylase family protein [Desulfofundulus sp.]|uniref:phosphotransacetylase family protein n=1 Tax=Desulfofundulus sp. TaxID=2282750 RepID=UPI003C78814B
MKNLYIMGTAGSGKTAIAVGLALKLVQHGYKVAYFKPVGHSTGVKDEHDEDAELMQEVLELKHPLDIIVPYIAGPSYLSGYRQCETLERILSCYRQVSNGADVVLIGGAAFPHIMGCLGLDAVTLAKKFEALVLFTIRIENDFSLDEAIFINSYLSNQGVRVLGNIFNNVPRPLLAKTEGIYKAILTERGYPTLGIIPQRPEISSPTVAEFYETLGGEILAGEDNMDRLVEDVIVGAMTIESALGYLRRAPNKAVITGGDRADLALAALETNTSVLILTGGLYPDVKVIARAAEKNVPVLLVHYDTFTTIEKLAEISQRIRPRDRKRIALARENIEKYCDLPAILKALAD